jgi:hypothetical protein
MRLNIEQDVAMWRERMKGMKEQIKGRLDGDEAARRRLLTEGSKESIKDFLAKVCNVWLAPEPSLFYNQFITIQIFISAAMSRL